MILVLTCSIIFISGNDNLRHFNRFFMVGIITLVILIGSLLIYTSFKFFKNKSNKWNRNVQIINWILIILLAFTITLTVQMNYQISDAQYCINTAKALAPSMNWHDVPYGNKEFGQYYALIRCYNMAPFIYLQALFIKFCSLIGIKLSFSAIVGIGVYANAIMLLISLFISFNLIKRHCKLYTQTGFTFLLLINIPLYQTVYYVYTDIPSLLAVMIILYAYDSLIYSKKPKNKVILISIIIFTSIIGSLFKFNVIIALFAIVIHYTLTHNWKKSIKFLLLLLTVSLLGIGGIKKAITITSPIPQTELGLPSINWINMSFSRTDIDGSYNEKYFAHTFKLKNKYKTNKKVNKIELKEFINGITNNPKRYFYIMYQKLGATYGIGNYNFNDFFKSKNTVHKNLKNTLVGKIVYGNYKKIFLYGSFVFQLSLFLFMGLGTFKLINKKISISPFTPWMIALFGNMFMLLFWETRARYLLAFSGVIYIIACASIEQIQNKEK